MTTTMDGEIAAPKPNQQQQQHLYPQRRRVCFSFAAYAKAVMEHLRASQIPVLPGLSDSEFSAIESSFGFTFPPDLRSILREGLPVGVGFPNWRSSSAQQLQTLLGLPVSGFLAEVSRGCFWCEAWGSRPVNPRQALTLAKEVFEGAPFLVPIYGNFYIPSEPNLAGNPVFFVRGCEVRCSGFDLADFFQREELREDRGHVESPESLAGAGAPAWTAKSARRIEVWTDLLEGSGGAVLRGRLAAARGGGGALEVEKCLKEMGWRLREGGWREEEVREMLMAGNGVVDEVGLGDRMVLMDQQSVLWHVRLLSLTLIRAGWTTEDVVYSMGGVDQSREMTWQGGPIKNEVSVELQDR